MKIFFKIYEKFFSKLNHVNFAKYKGVNMGKGIFIYGDPYKMFGTEPWLITLGNNVHITSEVLFITHDGDTLLYRHLIPNLEITAPITIGNNVYIGVRSIILPDVTIGNNCIIAASLLVAKNIPNNTVFGVPAKFIETSDEYFEEIKKRSLKLGHLKGLKKDKALRKHFNYK